MRHFWRNRIGFSTSSEKKDYKSWDLVLHNRIAKYVRLYTQILDFHTFMLVSHRDMISVFDMKKDSGNKYSFSNAEPHRANQENLRDEAELGETVVKNEPWACTHKFESGQVRRMFTKKRSREEREKNTEVNKNSFHEVNKIVCFIGINHIETIKVDQSGNIKPNTRNKVEE